MARRTGESGEEWLFDGNARWPYQKYVRTYLLKPLSYRFVRDHYDRTLEALAAEMGPRTRERLAGALDAIVGAGVATLYELIERVATQTQAEDLMIAAGLDRPQIEAVVDHVKRVILPNVAQVRQCIADDEKQALAHFATLKAHKLASGYALLERGHTPALRAALAQETGLPEEAILDLVHRVDITRMPWMGGRMVKMLWWVGIRSLQDLRDADAHEIFERLNAYYAAQGTTRPYDATDSTMQSMVTSARRIPTVVQM